MWIRTWSETVEAWGAPYETTESELMCEQGEKCDLIAECIFNDGGLSSEYTFIDDFLEDDIVLLDSECYSQNFVDWYKTVDPLKVTKSEIRERLEDDGLC